MKDTPIFITVRDRLTMFLTVVDRLESQGYHNLHIVDTGSSYRPMLGYLATTKLPIHRAPADMPNPHLALWNHHIIDGSGKIGGWYVNTDCDVLPDCPDDWLQRLRDVLERHPDYPKAGLGLRIDDLPDHFAKKSAVIEWESQFWGREIEPGFFDAAIDTTLALYRPGVWWGNPQGMRAIRTGGAYQARHLPWYTNSNAPAEDETYYWQHMNRSVGHWKP